MNRPTLLCVENDSTLPDAYGAFLGNSGYHVLVAKDYGQALLAIRHSHVDAILVDDYQKAGASGREVAAEIKQKSPTTPVLLVSGLQNVVEEARNFVDATLSKGADLGLVLAQVDALLKSGASA